MIETGFETKKECVDIARHFVQDGIKRCHPEEPQAFSYHPEESQATQDLVLTLEKQHQILPSLCSGCSAIASLRMT